MQHYEYIMRLPEGSHVRSAAWDVWHANSVRRHCLIGEIVLKPTDCYLTATYSKAVREKLSNIS